MLPTINGIGRLTDDPELRFTPGGKAVAKVRLAFSDRKKDQATGEWSDGDKVYLDASVWGDEAEHLCESLQRGMEVQVSGKLRQREYDAKDGTKRTVYELAFATVSPTLRYATAKIQKMQRSNGGGQSQPAQAGGNFDDPWSSGSGNGPGRGASDDSPPPF